MKTRVLAGLAGVTLLALAGAIGARWWRHAPSAQPAPCDGDAACVAHPRASATVAPPMRGRPRLLAFSSSSCVACAKMAPVVAQAERACAAQGAVVHLDLDDDDGSALATTYRVTSIPAWLAVDSDGHEVSRIVGVQSLDTIQQAIEEVRGARCARLDEAPAPSRPM